MAKKVFMYATPVRTAATLLDTIEACIAPVLIVITGTWAPYRNCETMNNIHQTVNHTENLDPTTGAHTQTSGHPPILFGWRELPVWCGLSGKAPKIVCLTKLNFQSQK